MVIHSPTKPICLFAQFQTFICWDDKECIWWEETLNSPTTSPSSWTSWAPWSPWSSYWRSWWSRWRLPPDELHKATFAEIQLATDCTRVYYLPQRIYSTRIYHLARMFIWPGLIIYYHIYSAYIWSIMFGIHKWAF